MLVHPDDARRMDDLDPRLRADHAREPCLVADEDKIRGILGFRPIQQRAPDYLVRGVVTAHGVDGDAHDLGRGGRAPRLDLYHLTAAVGPAMRARLVRGLRAAALRTCNEVLRDKGEMTPTFALRGMRDPLLGLTGQLTLLNGGASIVSAQPGRPDENGVMTAADDYRRL